MSSKILIVTGRSKIVEQVRNTLPKDERRLVVHVEHRREAENKLESRFDRYDILILDSHKGTRATEDFIVNVKQRFDNFNGQIVLLGSSTPGRADLTFDLRTEEGKDGFKSYLAGIK